MRSLVLKLAAAMVCVGCQQQAVPLTISPGATLEVFMMTDMGDPTAVVATDPGTGRPLFLKTPPVVSTNDVATVGLSEEDIQMVDGKPSGHRDVGITVTLTPAGSAKMATETANASGDRVAFLVNGKIYATPRVHTQIQKSFRISGAPDDISAAFEGLTKP
jgi:preprotein translocase subunit SecD